MTEELKSRKAPKKFHTVPVSQLISCQKRLGLATGEFMTALGYTRSGYHEWLDAGQCPATAALAAEALVRRQGNSGGLDTILVLRITSSGHVEVLSHAQLDTVESITVAGKKFLLLPSPEPDHARPRRSPRRPNSADPLAEQPVPTNSHDVASESN